MKKPMCKICDLFLENNLCPYCDIVCGHLWSDSDSDQEDPKIVIEKYLVDDDNPQFFNGNILTTRWEINNNADKTLLYPGKKSADY